MSVSNVLVVCTANICRSPMAEALLRARAEWLGVHSAGLRALTGQPADPLAIAVLAQHGLDLRLHRSRPADAELCLSADLILVMEVAQKVELENRYPVLMGRVFRLSPQAGTDIVDPYNGGRHAFERTFASIEVAVRWWCARFETLRAPAFGDGSCTVTPKRQGVSPSYPLPREKKLREP